MTRLFGPSLAIGFGGAFVINLLSHTLGWSEGRTGLTLVLFLVGLLFARNRIDRAAILLTAAAELIFLAEPWAYWASVPIGWIGLAGWITFINVKALAEIRFEPRPDQFVASGVRDDVDRYRAIGFSIVGSAEVRGQGFETVFTYLLSNDLHTYAVATDRVRALTSVFDQRELLTISEAAATVPAAVLRQMVVRGSIEELTAAHDNTLTVLSRLGHHPQLLSPREVVAISIGLDQRTIEAIRAAPARLFGYTLRVLLGFPVPHSALLTDSPQSRARIDAWARAE